MRNMYYESATVNQGFQLTLDIEDDKFRRFYVAFTVADGGKYHILTILDLDEHTASTEYGIPVEGKDCEYSFRFAGVTFKAFSDPERFTLCVEE